MISHQWKVKGIYPRLIREVTRLLAEILGKNPQTTVVVMEEVDTDNWASAEKSVTVRRQRERQGKP
jgi:4-oxalocrotonate tautomerase